MPGVAALAATLLVIAAQATGWGAPEGGPMVAFIPARGRATKASDARSSPRLRAAFPPGDGGGSGSDGIGAAAAWWNALLETYRKRFFPKPGEQVQISDEEWERDLDVTTGISLVGGVLNSYVVAAPPAVPPDCTSYSPEGACCPSLACYRSVPFGLKLYVTVALLLAVRTSLKNISSPVPRSDSAKLKCALIAGVSLQTLYTLFGS